jgi:acetylornithine deacetylase/succinyl-diaminopimelate desuccinylase-like protein
MKIVTPPNAVPCLVVRMGCAYPEFKLILSGHLNSVNEGTVREPINPLVKDGIIYERGASDMKAVVPL